MPATIELHDPVLTIMDVVAANDRPRAIPRLAAIELNIVGMTTVTAAVHDVLELVVEQIDRRPGLHTIRRTAINIEFRTVTPDG
jgi:hypothetical protein